MTMQNLILYHMKQINDILNKYKNKPKYPKTYQIYNIDYTLDNEIVKFEKK